MPEHTIGTRQEWQAARDQLAVLEAEQAGRDEEINRKRRELPWVPVEKDYAFDTEDGKKQLAALTDLARGIREARTPHRGQPTAPMRTAGSLAPRSAPCRPRHRSPRQWRR